MKRIVVILAVLALLTTAAAAHADQIRGSFGFNPFGNWTTVDSHTFIMPQPAPGVNSGVFVNSGGTQDFSIVACVPFTDMTWLSSSALDVNNAVGWTMGSAAFGTWTTTRVVTHGLTFGVHTLFMEGTFTPGTMFGGLTATNALMTLQVQTGGALNGNGTMAMVPEPSSLIVLFGGLGSLIALKRRRA